jgi:hypothetical protein
MQIGYISALFVGLIGCSTMTPRTCEQKAWEAAGNAMSNVQYNLNRQSDRNAMVNCSSANGCPSVPQKDNYYTGESSGQYSNTDYRGLNPRQAYDNALKDCAKKL